MNEKQDNDETKRLSYERQNAVRKAWKEEQIRVSEGRGTRRWSTDEQKELLERGSVRGYEGHHMKSISLYPEYAGEPSNIQFLSEVEHLYGAHGGSYHNLTNGYYDPEKSIMIDFGDELGSIPEYDLTETNGKTLADIRKDYCDQVDSIPKQNVNNIQDARDNYGRSDAPTDKSMNSSCGEGKSHSGERR